MKHTKYGIEYDDNYTYGFDDYAPKVIWCLEYGFTVPEVVGFIYDVFQDYEISEKTEEMLYGLADPFEWYNTPSRYDEDWDAFSEKYEFAYANPLQEPKENAERILKLMGRLGDLENVNEYNELWKYGDSLTDRFHFYIEPHNIDGVMYYGIGINGTVLRGDCTVEEAKEYMVGFADGYEMAKKH